MIAAAARALKPGGRLFLVANRQLPYEQVLADDFRHAGETVRDASYKVLWAVR
jgi:16S rRNA (guanine1207-N2)-methyltransferase